MKSIHRNKNTRIENAAIDLLRQNVWKELEATKITAYSKLDDKKIHEIEILMDRAFDTLLKKIIQQS